MARLLVLLLGGIALALYLRRRGGYEFPEYSPADELRSKLAETRVPGDEPAPDAGLERDLEDRRREVYDRAHGAIDDLT